MRINIYRGRSSTKGDLFRSKEVQRKGTYFDQKGGFHSIYLVLTKRLEIHIVHVIIIYQKEIEIQRARKPLETLTTKWT